MTSADDLRDSERFHLGSFWAQRISLVLGENVLVEIDEVVEVREDLVCLWVLERVANTATQ